MGSGFWKPRRFLTSDDIEARSKQRHDCRQSSKATMSDSLAAKPVPVTTRPSAPSTAGIAAPLAVPGTAAHAGGAHHSIMLSPSGTHTPTGSILLNKTGSSPGSRTTSPPPASSTLLQTPIDASASHDAANSARTPSPILSTGSPSFTSPFGAPSTADASGTTSPSPHLAQSPGANTASSTFAGAVSAIDESQKSSKASSPHCHFAPLPKVDQDHRPSTRRNSSVSGQNRVKPFVAHATNTTTVAADTNDAYSTRLDGEHLGRALQGLSLQPSPRPGRSRHGSEQPSADRSSSPSPSRRNLYAADRQMAPPSTGSGHSSRNHSPAMSRRASTDAMSLHYIEGSGISKGIKEPHTQLPPRLIRRESSTSRERERQMFENRERELEFERQRMREHKSEESRDRQASGGGGGGVGLGSTSLSRTASPIGQDAAPQVGTRKPMFVEPSAEERTKPPKRPTNEEIVEIEPGEENNKQDELEEVAEEDEDDEDGNGNGTNEEEGDDDEDDDGDDNDEDNEDDAEEQEAAAERATSRGAAVEVVHWHKDEEDDHQSHEEEYEHPAVGGATETGHTSAVRPVAAQGRSVRHHSTGQHSVRPGPTTTSAGKIQETMFDAVDSGDDVAAQQLQQINWSMPNQGQRRRSTSDETRQDHAVNSAQSAEYSEIHLAPATRTSVVTTTTTTTVHFAPILVPRSLPIKQRHSSFTSSNQPPTTPQSSLLQFLETEERRHNGATELDPKLYPLSQTPYPGGLRRFKMKLGNVDGTFYESGREASGSTMAPERRESAADVPYELVDSVGSSIALAPDGDKRKTLLHLTKADHKATLASRRAAARRSRTTTGNSQVATSVTSHLAINEQDEVMADDTAPQQSPGPPRKRPRESPPSPAAEPAESMSFAEDRNEITPLSPGSLQRLPTNAGSLPSPNLSPPSPVPTFVGDNGAKNDATEVDEDIRQPDFGSGYGLATLSALPDVVQSFDQLPPQLQSYFLFTLLKRSSVPVLQTINNIISPALRRDFLTDLPPELGVHVLGFLDHQSLCRASVVCRGWRRLTDGEWRVWKQRLVQDGLLVGDGSEERDAAEIMHGRKENLFLKRWRAGVWEEPPLTTWSGKTDDGFDPTESQPAGGRRMSNVRLASPSSSRESSPFGGSSHFTHPYKTLYRRRFLVRRNWQTKAPIRTTFSCNSNSVITSLQFDKDKVVSASDDHSINVFDTRTGARKARLSDHDGGVWALQYIGNVLVSGSTDRTVRVWDLDRAKCTHTFVGHTSTVRCLQIVEPENINPDGSGAPIWEPPFPLIVTGSRDWSLRVWKLPFPGRDAEYHPIVPQSPTDENIDPGDNPYHLRHLAGHRHAVRALAARGRTLVSGSYDCSVRVWDILTGECKHRLQGHTQKVYSVVYDHQRQQCASGSMDGTVRLWSTTTGECIVMLDGHSSLVGLLGLSHKHLVSAAADSTLRVWNPETGSYQHTLAAHSGAITCFQHDAHKVISGSDGTLKMWDVNDGSFTRDLITGLTGVWQVAFDERFCVAAVQRGGQSEFEVMDFGSVDDHESTADEEGGLVDDSSGDEMQTFDLRSTASVASSGGGQRRSFERSSRPELRVVPDAMASTSYRGRVVRRTPSTRNLAAAAAAAAASGSSNDVSFRLASRRRGSTSAATQTPDNGSSRFVAPNAPRLGALDDDQVLTTAIANRMHVDDMDQDQQER
ncbi:SCF ubiquitin ligase complex subunit cdc4 [Microbotryomycetes sp. JL201]|nr:SCF ubiquitin ligase complex subunit cdc4 [Microbotryomycetes sp. JL201]